MHILFVHRNFPAQFGHIAANLLQRKGYRCTFVSELPGGFYGGVERIQYRVVGGARETNHYCSRSFENAIWHTHGVYEALKARPDIRPDLVVGHSGFGSTLFLGELYQCPVINYFEYFYHTTNSDLDFRPDFPPSELDRLRARARNAMILLDLDHCDAGYCPTYWQRDRFPEAYRNRLEVIFDGIDTSIWKPLVPSDRMVGGRKLPDAPIITYVSRGLESMRGFDQFMKVANHLCRKRKDVQFVIVGADRVAYGGDQKITGEDSFKNWVLKQDVYDLQRFHFLDPLPMADLAKLFTLTDLHIYLTVPFVLSWSLLNALACGAVVLASNTDPVCEVIKPGINGLLADFFDIEAIANLADRVLDNPNDYRRLGQAGVETVKMEYSLDVCLPRLVDYYQSVCQRNR